MRSCPSIKASRACAVVMLLVACSAGCSFEEFILFNKASDPCADEGCAGHGTCVVDAEQAQCRCDEGYRAEGLTCVPAECVPQEESALCLMEQAECGWLTVPECGQERTVRCGACLAELLCGGAGTPHVCALPGAWTGLGSSEFGPRSDGSAWGTAGGAGVIEQGLVTVRAFHLRLDSRAEPLVSWAGQDDLSFLRWAGTSWTAAADPLTATSVMAPDLLADRPVVALEGDRQILVKHWTSSTWDALGASGSGGGVSNATGGARQPAIAAAADGAVAVAWLDSSNGAEAIYLRRWDPRLSDWIELDGSASAGGLGDVPGLSSPTQVRLALTGGGEPVVAWTATSATHDRRVYLKRWNGTGWAALGDSLDGPGVSTSPNPVDDFEMAVDGRDRVVVAWSNPVESRSFSYFVRRWSESAWSGLGGSDRGIETGITTGSVVGPRVAIHSQDRPCVAWQQGNVFVRCWDDNNWSALGRSDFGGGISQSHRTANLFLDGLASDGNGTLAVSWNEVLTPLRDNHYLKLWNGSVWQALGPNPLYPGGLSDTSTDAVLPRVIFDATGVPVVLWLNGGDQAPFVKRWSGGQWRELGGSASGAGIADASLSRTDADLVADAEGRLLVVYSGRRGEQSEVSLKRWSGSGWEALGGASASPLIVESAEYDATSPKVMVSDDAVTVAWIGLRKDDPEIGNVFLARWDGESWTGLGGSLTGNGVGKANIVFHPLHPAYNRLALVQGTAGQPVLAFADEDPLAGIVVTRWTGTDWERIGEALSKSVLLEGPISMVADPAGRIAVAHETPIRDVAVELWEGTSWRTLPILAGKIFGDDVQNVPNQTAPSVAFDKTGAPVVAFSQLNFRTSRVDVHVRVWRDDQWRDVGGNAPGGGSNSDAVSFSPSLATRGDVACVAWHENGAGSFQVLLRCADL